MANIVIERGKKNTVIMTVSCRSVLTSPYYLFHFKSKFNPSEERFFNAANISQNRIRFDEFLITESNSPDYNNGEVDLFTGEWKYAIYESSGSTLNISGTTGNILETDMVIVIDKNYK